MRRANLAAPHPAAEICEIYSVNSPHTKVRLVQNGRDVVRYGYVRTRHAQLELCGCGFHGNTAAPAAAGGCAKGISGLDVGTGKVCFCLASPRDARDALGTP